MRWLLGALWCVASLAAQALEFRSVSAEAAVLYDAPSVQSRKIFILSRYYPVEIIVALDTWAKVRDTTGALAWVETSKLTPRRTVLVIVPVAEIRGQPDAGAPLVFKAERDVALELVEIVSGGWIKVKHRDGQSGFVPMKEVWGI